MVMLPLLMISVVAAAVSNTILRRIALVPMQAYPYFLTQCQILTYTFLYGIILYTRYNRGDGTVTVEMLRIPKRPFVWIGFWDALGDVLGNIGTSKLPGYQVPLLAKLNIIFSAIFSWWILRKTYSWYQIGAMAILLSGTIVTLLPTIRQEFLGGDEDGSREKNESEEVASVSMFYTLIYIASVAPTALAFVLKEEIFRIHQRLDLDIFVVNTFGSIVGLAFSVLLLPLASVPGLGGKDQVPLTKLPEFMFRGSECFRGMNPTVGDDCRGAPLAPSLYLGINVVYNIFVLLLVKHGGALLMFLTNTITFPLSAILFVLPWPLLGPSKLSIFVVLGLITELSGIILYQHATSVSRSEKGTDRPDLSLQVPEAGRSDYLYGSIKKYTEEEKR